MKDDYSESKMRTRKVITNVCHLSPKRCANANNRVRTMVASIHLYVPSMLRSCQDYSIDDVTSTGDETFAGELLSSMNKTILYVAGTCVQIEASGILTKDESYEQENGKKKQQAKFTRHASSSTPPPCHGRSVRTHDSLILPVPQIELEGKLGKS